MQVLIRSRSLNRGSDYYLLNGVREDLFYKVRRASLMCSLRLADSFDKYIIDIHRCVIELRDNDSEAYLSVRYMIAYRS